METDTPNTGGAGEDMLPYLEMLWRVPAKAPAHDPKQSGWLISAWVFALIACGSGLGAIPTASVLPLFVASASGLVSGAIVALHKHSRNRRIARWR